MLIYFSSTFYTLGGDKREKWVQKLSLFFMGLMGRFIIGLIEYK